MQHLGSYPVSGAHEQVAAVPSSVLWMTNLAAPYRLPVWDEMASRVDLTVALLESDHDVRSGSTGRGNDWQTSEQSRYRMRALPTFTVTRGEHRHHILGRGALRHTDAPAAILVGGWDSPAFWQVAHWGRKHGSRIVAFYESTERSQGFAKGPIAEARARFFRKVDGVVVPGRASARAVSAMGVPRDRIAMGFNAVDVAAIHSEANVERSRTFRSSEGGHRYVYVGQLIERKNIFAALDAFAQMAGASDRFSIVGAGPLHSMITEHVRSMGDIGRRVDIVGGIAYRDLPRELARHDTLVLPSREEVWGLVVNEALAAGLHVVVTEECGVYEDVAGMRGVFGASSSVEGLQVALRASRDSWDGVISTPEILRFGPRQFASVFEEALLKSEARSFR